MRRGKPRQRGLPATGKKVLKWYHRKKKFPPDDETISCAVWYAFFNKHQYVDAKTLRAMYSNLILMPELRHDKDDPRTNQLSPLYTDHWMIIPPPKEKK